CDNANLLVKRRFLGVFGCDPPSAGAARYLLIAAERVGNARLGAVFDIANHARDKLGDDGLCLSVGRRRLYRGLHKPHVAGNLANELRENRECQNGPALGCALFLRPIRPLLAAQKFKVLVSLGDIVFLALISLVRALHRLVNKIVVEFFARLFLARLIGELFSLERRAARTLALWRSFFRFVD